MSDDILHKFGRTHITIKNKQTDEVILSGNIVMCKDRPETMVSVDFKYFFTLRDNPLFEVIVDKNKDIIPFVEEKYKDMIFPYKSIENRDYSKEYIFREYDIKELDPEIAPLVYALNKCGIETYGSCCGHNKINAWVDIIFENWIQLKALYFDIMLNERFNEKFVLTTRNSNIDKARIHLFLVSTRKGEEAYKDILELSQYIEEKMGYLAGLMEYCG